ncbi:Conserved_hypothetical protein [Hexamita inflata]|uniref:Uncharacterized protein n=1 Tax=Hexamita inflata TaxID=28002 RepID=A0AA86TSD9_9EUKA|nr:Conserved hypothetical protein [Hexamita inflata]
MPPRRQDQNGEEEEEIDEQRQAVLNAQKMNKIALQILNKVKRARSVIFQSLDKPFRSVTRTAIAGCINNIRSITPKTDNFKNLVEELIKKPLQIENETLQYKEFKGEYVLCESQMNETYIRCVIFQTSAFFVFIFFTRSTTPLDLKAQIQVAQDIISEQGLDDIQLSERPQQLRLPQLLIDPNDDGIIFKKQKFPWALRSGRYKSGQEICLFMMSGTLPDVAWRIQEVVQLMQKFANVYFILDVVQLAPENFQQLADTCFFLNQCNIVWHNHVADKEYDTLFQKQNYAFCHCNQQGLQQLVSNDVDHLYDELCNTYFKTSDPESVSADVMFFERDIQSVVYNGVIQRIFNPAEMLQDNVPEEQPTFVRKSRKQHLMTEIIEPDPEPEDDNKDPFENDEEKQNNNKEEYEGENGGEEQIEKEVVETGQNALCVFASPKVKNFSNMIKKIIWDAKRFKHIRVYLCVQSSSTLNFNMFRDKIPEVMELKILLDTDFFYEKVVGEKQLVFQLFDKNNKLMLDSDSYEKAIEIILKKEGKKQKAEREIFEHNNAPENNNNMKTSTQNMSIMEHSAALSVGPSPGALDSHRSKHTNKMRNESQDDIEDTPRKHKKEQQKQDLDDSLPYEDHEKELQESHTEKTEHTENHNNDDEGQGQEKKKKKKSKKQHKEEDDDE